MCYSDEGGQSLLKNQFTSYQKARLLCSVLDKPAFEFNELQSVTSFVTVGGVKLAFAIMTTPAHSIPGSAVCAYSMDDIQSAMVDNVLEERTVADGYTYWAEVPIEDGLKGYIKR